MAKKITTFIELFEAYITYYKTDPIEGKKKGTTDAHTTKKNKVLQFLSQSRYGQDLKYYEFTLDVGKELYKWLKETDGRAHNYSVRVGQLCRAVFEWGIDAGHIKINPLTRYHLKKKKSDKPKVYLTHEQVVAIAEHRYESPLMQKCADLFLFQCYTGMDYIDLPVVNKSHLVVSKDGATFIVKAREKRIGDSLHYQRVPYFHETKALWEKYNYQLPKIEYGLYNTLIKEVGIVVGIVDIEISTKLGRKTFINEGVKYRKFTLAATQIMAGHASIRTTEEYYYETSMELVASEWIQKGCA